MQSQAPSLHTPPCTRLASCVWACLTPTLTITFPVLFQALQPPGSSSRGPPSIFFPRQVRHYHHYSQVLPYCCQPGTGQVEAEMYQKNAERLGRKTVRGKQRWRWTEDSMVGFFHATSPLLSLLWADTQLVRSMKRFSPASPSPLRDG